MIDRQSRWVRYVARLLDGLGVLLVIAACLSVLYYWDPTRTFVKRWQEPDPNVFERIDPALMDFRAAEALSVTKPDDIERVRTALTEAVWGADGIPLDLLPDRIERHPLDGAREDAACREKTFVYTRRQLRCELAIYAGWDNLASLEELRVSIDGEYEASVAHLLPAQRNGTLIVYQQGYASTYHDQHRLLERLNAQGYTIVALNHAAYGDNACDSKANVYCHAAWGTFTAPLPMRMHFSPIIAAINHALRDDTIDRIAMIGLSAGAWVTAVSAALDTRIELSIPVAGVMPKALGRGNEWPKAQRYEPLMSAASFLDLFTLATDSPRRRQVQIFNQYDRCCYSGLRPQLFADDLRKHIGNLTGGDFRVMIDDTHPRHKISRHAFRRIEAELERLGKRE